jgi:DNA repair protein RadC
VELDKEQEGHRKRLRDKFLKSGLHGFHDYEIVELLFTLGHPRKDRKTQAKEAIRRFKTLRGVLEASSEELDEIEGIGPYGSFGFKLVQAVAREYLKEKALEKPQFNSSQELYDYFYHSMRGLKKEVIDAVYLNSHNEVIEIADVSKGTVDSSFVYPREILEGAIKSKAACLVLVHNHPSGNPEPSSSDRMLTREIVFAAGMLQMRLLDHLIIGDNRYFSFAGEGWIEKCEAELRRLRNA